MGKPNNGNKEANIKDGRPQWRADFKFERIDLLLERVKFPRPGRTNSALGA
jgi:hypothetical protein